jgi:DNA segregation ATPase FtsK/SpoIIIE, S-DNA-T family
MKGVKVTGPSVKVPWLIAVLPAPLDTLAAIGWWLLRAALWLALRAVLAAKRHPDTTAVLALSCGLWWVFHRYGTTTTAVTVGPVLLVAFLWAYTAPASFDRCIENPARSRIRRALYRHRWARACATAGLSQPSPLGPLPPDLGRVRAITPTRDVIRARLNPKQTPEAWQQVAHHLARGLRVHTVRVQPYKGDRVELRCYRVDPLAEPVPPLEPITDVQQLTAVPVGIREDGQTFTLPLLYSHILVAGETGAGKGSCLWSLICGIAPLIHTGHVRLWVIDPKAGLELAGGAALYDEFAWGSTTDNGQPWQTELAEILEDAVTSMRARADRLRGTTRKHQPTPDAPLIVVVVDEVAALTAYVTDAALRRRITDALSLLLSQGRAVGISVVLATQDARKEVLTVRDLVPTRIALRAAEPTQADMVLGRDARNRGALTDRISRETPGVGYVSTEGDPDPVRVRFSHVTDDHIADVAARYAPPARTQEPA